MGAACGCAAAAEGGKQPPTRHGVSIDKSRAAEAPPVAKTVKQTPVKQTPVSLASASTPEYPSRKKGYVTDLERRYHAIAQDYIDQIRQLFVKLDANANGFLSTSEMKTVVEKYTGTEFNEQEFLGWYKLNTEKEDEINLTEFGWYIADVAWQFADPDIEAPLALQHVPCAVHLPHSALCTDRRLSGKCRTLCTDSQPSQRRCHCRH